MLLGCVAIALVAIAMRIAPIRAGLPYSDYIDEGYALSQVIDHLNTRSIDCRWYGYPTLTSYLTAAVAELAAPVYRLSHGRRFHDDLPKDAARYVPFGLEYNLISPPEVILAGRAVVVLASIFTVVVAWRLGTLIGGETTGWLAMLLTAVCPALVARSSNVIVDSTATLFATVSLYYAERLRRRWTSDAQTPWREAAFAGVAAGLALSSKYTVGAVFIAVALSIALAPGGLMRKLQCLVFASACAAAAALAANPAFILHPEIILQDMRQTSVLYGMLRIPPNYWGAAVSAKELGIPLLGAGLGGVVLMLARRGTRATAAAWLAFAIVLLIPLVPLHFQPFRNLLPLVPPLCVAAAVLFSLPRRLLTEWTPPRALRPLLLAAALVTAAFCAVSSARQVIERAGHTDTRVSAVDWIRSNTQPHERILAIAELAVAPTEWQRTGRRVEVVPWLEVFQTLERESFDYLIGGEMNIREATEPEWPPHLERWKAHVSTLPMAVSFGAVLTPVYPYLWRTNHERIIVWKLDRRAPAAATEDRARQ